MTRVREQRKSRINPKLRKPLWIASIALGALVLIIGSYTGYLLYKTNNALHKIAAPDSPAPSPSPSASAGAGPDGEVRIAGSEDADEDRKAITFLLAGIDNREGSGGTLNTDVLMLASMNPQTHSATLLSLPRDLRIKPPASMELNNHKANYFYAYFYNKSKEDALTNTKQFYSDLLQFPIDYMVMINFDGLRKLVDAVGGLTIDVDMNMKYRDTADGTDIDLKKGLQELNGKKALDFVRYRKSNEGTQQSSDIERNARQQQVLTQIMDKLASFQGMTQLGKVIDIVGDNVRSDIPESTLRSWMFDYKDMKPAVTTMLPLNSEWKEPYLYANEEDLTQALAALRSEAGLPAIDESFVKDVVGVIGSES